MPPVTFNMSIEGLLANAIEVELSGFSFGSSSGPVSNTARSTSRVASQEFRIQKVSDKWSSLLQQASHTGKQMHVSITVFEQLMNDQLTRATYSFSNAFIKGIQTSGSGAQGIQETIQFDSDAIDFYNSPTPVGGIDSYKGSHKGKTK